MALAFGVPLFLESRNQESRRRFVSLFLIRTRHHDIGNYSP